MSIISYCQAEITTHGSAGDISLHKKTDECSQILVVEKSVKLPDLSSAPIRSADTDASGRKPHEKLKKKIARRQVASLGFNPRFLRVSLAIQKKKKNKRSTNRPVSGSNNLTKELLVDNNSVPEVVPSTSEITNMVSLNSTHSQRKESKSASRIEASGTTSQDKIIPDSNSLKTVVDDGELMKRTSQNGSELAQDDQISAQPDCRFSVNQMIGMLTQGLGDTIGE